METTSDAIQGATPATRVKDWELIERDFRAGLLSVREIGGLHGVSHTAINKRAKVEGWTRDLKAKILAKAEAEVSKRAVSTEVSKEGRVAERQVIEANAEVIVQTRLAHRADIRRSRGLVMTMLAELEQSCGDTMPGLLRELGEIMRSPDEQGRDKLNDIYQAVISLPERSKTMKNLTESLRVLVLLERQAFGLDVEDEGDGGDKSFLEAMLNARARAAKR